MVKNKTINKESSKREKNEKMSSLYIRILEGQFKKLNHKGHKEL